MYTLSVFWISAKGILVGRLYTAKDHSFPQKFIFNPTIYDDFVFTGWKNGENGFCGVVGSISDIETLF